MQQIRNSEKRLLRQLTKNQRLAKYVMAHSRGDEHILKAFAESITDQPAELVLATSAWYVDVDLNELMDLEERLQRDKSPDAMRVRTFVMQYSIHEWIVKKNNDDGIAPTYYAVQQHLENTHRDRQNTTAAGSMTPKSRCWLRRFKRQWHLNHGRLQTQESGTKSTARTKAGYLLQPLKLD